MREVISRGEMRDAAMQLSGAAGEEPDPMAVGDWVVHDRVSPRLGRTVMQEFLHRNATRLTPRERELVESWARSSFGLYEVREVTPGKGAEVTDLLRGGTFFLHDVSLSRHMVRWDGMLARVIDGDRGQELTGVSMTVPRRQLEAMRQWLEEDRRESGLEWPEYFKRDLPRILRQPRELSREWLDGLQLSNSDGEELLFSKASYELADRATVIAALDRQKDLMGDEPGHRYSWVAPTSGPSGPTILGSITVEDATLTLDCNSRERLDRGKSVLSRIAGSGLRHVRDEFTTMKELKQEAAGGEEAPPPMDSGIPPEVETRLITEALERHYLAWPDHPLPALEGKTPRQAVRTAAGRKQVAALLRDLENGEEHKRKAGSPYFDVSRLRAELGLHEG